MKAPYGAGYPVSIYQSHRLVVMGWEKVRDRLLQMTPVCPQNALGVAENAVYAWWDLSGSLSELWPADFPAVDTRRPLYVGDAPSGLESRIIGMHLATTRMSGLRRSLAALLQEELELLPGITSVNVCTFWVVRSL